MLNIAAPEKFVLTLQSIPPFLIESILAFALAVLLAVPLIARLQLLFDNRENCGKSPDPINPPGRRLNRRNRHIVIRYPSSMATTSRSSQSLQLHSTRANNSFSDMKQSPKTLTSGPLSDQSQDQPEDETEEEKAENDDETMSGDNQILNFPYYEYQHYRHKLIKEHLKKNYGHFQAPGNVIFNSIHLSSIDSQRGIKYGDKHNHTLFNLVESLDSNDKNYGNRYSKCPELRDYFLTKGVNDKLETINRCTETVQSSIEVDKLPVMIGDKERANTPTGSTRKQRPLCAKKEKLSNDNTDSSNAVGSKIDTVDANSRPNSARKLIGRLYSRPGTPRSQLKSKKNVQPEVSIEFNPLTSNEHVEKTSDNSEQTQKQPSGFQNPSYTTEVPVRTATAAVVIEKPERPPTHVSSVVGKCPSMASSEAFSTCSSKNPERRPINTRPGSSSGGGGGISRAFRNLTSKVNSRPRSSGATFAWDKPNVPGKVPSYEEPTVTKIITSNAKRPKSANRKKSEVLSVLESIIDLSCDGTIDFQESTDDMVIKNFREMSDDIAVTQRMVHSSYPYRGGNSRVSANMRKPKTPVSPSNQRRTETSTNSKIDKKEFLRARSGIYSKWSAVGHSRR